VADELREADLWLKETLSVPAITALLVGGIHAGEVVPQSNPVPYLRFQFQGDSPNLTMDGFRYLDPLVYLVAAVLPLTGNPLLRGSQILDAADDALRARIGTAMPSGATVHGVLSRAAVRYPDPPDRPAFLHYGRLYEVQVSAGG
jgi:hypothetical protein